MNQLKFQITGKCNLNCAFCSDLVSYQKERSVQEIKDVLNRFIQQGLKKIQISGGEPLMFDQLEEVLRFLKEQNLEISLSTNGINLLYKRDILSYVDEIILPLDGVYSKTLTEMGREKAQLVNTIKNIISIKEQFPQLKVKISTVLNKQNVKELENMTKIITRLPINEWELHQFLPHGKGKQNIQNFLLDDREFQEIVLYLQTTSIGEKIIPISASDKIRTEWILTPSLYMIQLKEENPRFYGKVDELGDLSIRDMIHQPLKKIK